MIDYIVEFIGTLIFMYVIITTGNPYIIGITLTLCILAGGHISGGNFNPAASFMNALAGNLPVYKVIPYVGAQLLAAFIALHLYRYVSLIRVKGF